MGTGRTARGIGRLTGCGCARSLDISIAEVYGRYVLLRPQINLPAQCNMKTPAMPVIGCIHVYARKALHSRSFILKYGRISTSIAVCSGGFRPHNPPALHLQSLSRTQKHPSKRGSQFPLSELRSVVFPCEMDPLSNP
jgi:hypothetical protein